MRFRRAAAALLVLAAWSGVADALDFGDGIIRLRTGAYSVHEGPAPEPARTPESATDDPRSWIVAYEGPSDGALIASIEDAGATIHAFVPSHAYLVRARSSQVDALRQCAGVLRVDRVRPAWKISPDIGHVAWRDPERVAEGSGLRLWIDLFDDVPLDGVIARLANAGAQIVAVSDGRAGSRRCAVRAPADRVAEIAELAAVSWIEEAGELELRNDAARWVIQSDVPNETPLHDHGLFGEGEIVGHIDGEIALESCYFRDPVDNTPGPDHRKLVAYRSSTGFGANNHGTHTAGTAAGDPEPIAGFLTNRGMAPKARISHTNFFDIEGFGDVSSNLFDMLSAAHADGARVHTNSWGETILGGYTTWSVDVDAFSRANEDDLVVFAIANSGTVVAPENSKNCLAVGKTNRAPDEDQQTGSNATGPTFDGRRKPDVCAPGVLTNSASSIVECATVMFTGTSMAAPAVAGGAVLVREYFVDGYFPTGQRNPLDSIVPTGALLKATVINGAVDLTGVAGYPSDREGWGRILLHDALYFRGDRRRLWLRDVRHVEGLATGEVDTYRLRVAGNAEPVKITLVFVDQPASHLASVAPVNDLDLEVEGPDGLFLGNVFDVVGGESNHGGAPDLLNNVERVIREVPTPGVWTIRVRGTDVPLGPQGYAIVVNGELFQATPIADGDQEDDPSEFELEAPFPTPFRDSTELRWATPSSVPILLAIYDVSGRRVRTLVDRVVDAGEFRTLWDGRDDRGARVADGIYFARFVAPGFERVRRTVRLR